MPGDYATVDEDGAPPARARLGVINTGGEKVYPEEVEEVLKTIRGCRTRRAWARPTTVSGSASRRSSARPGETVDPDELVEL